MAGHPPRRRDRQIPSAEQTKSIIVNSYCEHLYHIHHGPMNVLENYWQEIPKNYQQESRIIAAYASGLLHHHLHNQAEKLLMGAFKGSFDLQLFVQYSFIETDSAAKQLKQAEALFEKVDTSVTALLAMARICLRNKLSGRAKQYVERAQELQKTPIGFYLLGQVFEQENNMPKALSYYHQAGQWL